MIGVALVLVRHGVIDPPAARLEITSDLPASVGVASSAALEVATARALGAGDIDPLLLASLCQEAENHVVGAPCGIMDQVAVALGTAGACLPILCRPASVADAVVVPSEGSRSWAGRPERRTMSVARRTGGPGRQPSWASAWWRTPRVAPGPGSASSPRDAVAELPEELDGARLPQRWGATDDDVTTVRPDETYPVRAATVFGVEEHGRAVAALAACVDGEPERLGPLMEASQAGYDAMGLGHAAATATVEEALARPGVFGARSSGGGCGGTVWSSVRAGRIGRRGRADPLNERRALRLRSGAVAPCFHARSARQGRPGAAPPLPVDK